MRFSELMYKKNFPNTEILLSTHYTTHRNLFNDVNCPTADIQAKF